MGAEQAILDLARTFFHFIRGHFAFSPRYTGSLILIWGGLLVIGTVSLVLMLRAAVTGDLEAAAANAPVARKRVLTSLRATRARLDAEQTAALARALSRREDEFQRGRIAGHRANATTLDEALDGAFAVGLGDPRIVNSQPGLKRIRLNGCRSCRAAREGRNPNHDACEYERAFMQARLERMLGTPVQSKQTACGAAHGGEWCEFEYRY